MSSEDVEFTIKRFVLMGLCEKAVPVISSGEDGILRCFLVNLAPGSITLTGSDLELVVQAHSTAVATEDTATLAIPAKRLRDMLKEAPEGDVTVSATGSKATVTAGNISWDVRLGNAADFTLPHQVDESSLQAVKREDFLTALRVVRHAICRDGGRPPLMMVDITDNSMTASDGSRLQRYLLDFPVDMKIPAAAVPHLVRMLSASEAAEVSVDEQEGYLVFQVGITGSQTTFIARKTMARFPDMERLIITPSKDNPYLLLADRRALLEAIRRVRITADPETSAIGLRLSKDKITVISRDKNDNAAEQQIAAWWKQDDRLLVVNHIHLTEMLEVWTADSCRFWLGADTGKKKSMLMLSDKHDQVPATQIGVIQQLHAALLGYA